MERIVQQTDYDALSCRISAISKGYLPSPSLQIERCHYNGYREMHVEYLRALKNVSMKIHSKVYQVAKTSFPVMNYGTYLRTVSIDLALDEFLKLVGEDRKVQVVNLGCGSDLRMVPLLRNHSNLFYVDVDYESSISVKRKVLWESPMLREMLDLKREDATGEVSSERYKLLPCDLNRLDQTMRGLEALTGPDCPTVIISECLLCYMADRESQQLIDSVKGFYKSGSWISYDPIGGSAPGDRFGVIMQNNLKESRNLDMPTLMVYNSTEKYASRFHGADTTASDMWEVLTSQISNEESARLRSLQFLDEIEELKVMQKHYLLLVARW
ncbi:hypothetical protein HG536_0A05650 [Torulaspora globosa]|uniref:Leucine carboxyl methyltransferase 1 n=1 Tax=Torulaspora globosa TaxID=48254 RepID=A0A7G3ZB64_9SACH|nr:uncharacterized protein HG536_0A05650 [Torulaspora globosa]QLL30750.1 hypothetical protein HG536_0A05650 [Torulaspora globosa]